MDATLTASLAAAAAIVFAGLWVAARRRCRRLTGEAEDLRRRMERAQEARETFFDLATHELRSPLSAILGYQELLADGAYGSLDAASEPVRRIGRSAQHLLHLIDGLVELSRIRTGTVRPDLGPVDLGVLIASATDAFRALARERGIETDVRVEDLPAVRSDRDRLVRALDLLITSAVKHPGDGSVRLEARADDDGVTVRLSGTRLDTHADADDPALRFGIRLAVAQGVARVLGGDLELDIDGHGAIRSMALRIPDAAGPAGPAESL